jgi:hypothetical protein
MAQNGNNIIVYKEGVAIASTKSDELQVDCDMIEIANSSEQSWKNYINGRKSWSLNASWLVSAVTDIRKVLDVGTRVQLKIKGRDATDAQGVTGYAYIKSCKVSMTRGNLAIGNFQFIGDGQLS